jgi:3-deoxy-D-manno-octulosonic-acid transferase
MGRGLYTVLLRLATPFVLARWWWRGAREPLYREAIPERFGRSRLEPPPKLLWIHAVSVGEARAAMPLIDALAREHPDHALLITCTTAAGRATLKRLYGESLLVAWLPYDLPEAVQRFLEHFRPRLGVLMETEIWPNLLAGCAENGVPVVLANARMSERSARGYARHERLSRPAFEGLACVCAQSESDAARLRALGAPKVEVTGNLKFDVQPEPAQAAAGRAWRERVGRPVLLLASTREGEEKMLLDALPVWDGKLLVLVVPRHPQRFEAVAGLAQSRRSSGAEPAASERVHLGDTLGEMAFYYAACDVAVIGGSFAPLGGQNLIEALANGVPVVLGPSMYNFAEATRLALEAGAALQAPDAATAVNEALRLIGDAPRRARMSEAGRKLCAAHRGAASRHMSLLHQVLTARAPD